MLGAILTWAADNPVYRKHIALYKSKQRPILRGADVYHILPMPDGINWDGLEFFNSACTRAQFSFLSHRRMPPTAIPKLSGSRALIGRSRTHWSLRTARTPIAS